MKMLISEIEYKNIRKISSFKMNFQDPQGKYYKNNFIMMGNGTGKTTTINLIKGLLDGSAEFWDKEQVESYRPLKNESVTQGQFSVTVKFDEKFYKYFLNLNYKEGKASISCTTSLQGGYEGKRSFPEAIESLFTPEFVSRFVFDGEQAQKSLDTGSNEAEETIKYLYRLNELDNIMLANRRILKEIQDVEERNIGSDQSIKNLRTRKERCEKRIEEMNKEVSDLDKGINTAQSSIKGIEEQLEKIERNFGDLSEKKRELTGKCQETKVNMSATSDRILDKLKYPYLLNQTLCQRMFELGDSMAKLKLPKTISKDFFIELSGEKHCICGTEIGEKERENILVNAERYLGSDRQGVLNTIKSYLINCSYNEELEDLFKELATFDVEYQRYSGLLSNVERELQEAGGEKGKELRRSRDEIQKKIGAWEGKRNSLTSKNENDPSLSEENNINIAQKQVNELEKKISSATRTNKALRKKNIIDGLISEIKNNSFDLIKKEIICKTNEKLKSVIKDDVIQIESIDKCIRLYGKSGASEGQTLSIAYCFLGTMFEDSELLFPFVIDSPAGKMDYEKRKAIAEILPTLFNQLIAFVTSAEVEKFADQFYLESNTQFVTVIASAENEEIEVHYGKEYFDTYQRDHKEENVDVSSF
ncbi:hypothetical protein [Lacrimispora sp.]|uniref:hypothetical protein n=1 Tax=Lacrimispora sp. TaxID=2719234 RepID=UPI00289E8A9A|nr:hypothetical protein [Lacrimispora sp.]